MASIDKIKAELKAWTPGNGQPRYYVNDWKETIGLEVGYHNTGNVKWVCYDGNDVSNNWFNKNIRSTKVWFDGDGEIHVDRCNEPDVVEDIKTKVGARFEVA